MQKNKWETVYSWNDIDHIKPHRWPLWYLVFIIVMVWSSAWGIYEGVYSMSVAFFLLLFVYLIFSSKDPVLRENKITTLWIFLWKKFIPYSDIHSFWFIYFSNAHLLHLKLNTKLNPVFVVPVVEWDSSVIRDLISWRNIIEIEGRGESVDETVTRIFKL